MVNFIICLIISCVIILLGTFFKAEENRELLDEVAKLFETKDIKLERFYEYVDIVMCEKAVNLNSRNVSDSLFQQMIVLNDWVVEQQFKSEFGVYVGGNLIDQVHIIYICTDSKP